MCSIIDGLTIHRKLQSISSQSSNLTMSITYDDDLVEWCIPLTFLARLIAYIAILTVLVIVAFMVMKYINEYEETSLQPAGKAMRSTYGTCEEWDIESGNCSSSSSNSNNAVITSSSEDLYDGKICVICYTEQRDCFLVPCGHCATCYVCAESYVDNSKRFRIWWCSIEIWYLITEITCCRIFYGETKTCPICRRFIRKVRRLFAA